MPLDPALAARRCQHALNALHSTTYFSSELHEELGQLGIKDHDAAYLASRSAALGAVGAGVVTGAFYVWKRDVIAEHLPAVWETASPREVTAARLRAADRVLTRLLGADGIASESMAEAARLALQATEGCFDAGRPMYAAHADLDIPEEPHLALWHAATLLREFRGDGHLAVLADAELDALEAQITHAANGDGPPGPLVREKRGWSVEEWSAAEHRLRERGILGADGNLTDAGNQLRADLEAETDRLDRSPYQYLGTQLVGRLGDLAVALTRAAIEAGAFPPPLVHMFVPGDSK
ncbi:SCO6745 family protein [Streptomyces lutosisoli]|uniref:SalK n=1 Tax=Streptomyces lutosisoli TaxID=2665721 RepID=A0ABW2VIY4_9ACTN